MSPVVDVQLVDVCYFSHPADPKACLVLFKNPWPSHAGKFSLEPCFQVSV